MVSAAPLRDVEVKGCSTCEFTSAAAEPATNTPANDNADAIRTFIGVERIRAPSKAALADIQDSSKSGIILRRGDG